MNVVLRFYRVFLFSLVGIFASCENLQKVPRPQEVIEIDQFWWKSFDDPLMNKLADILLNENIDIRIAISRLQQARALANLALVTAVTPTLSNASSITNTNMDIISGAINQTNQQITIAQGGFNASWELDILGHNRMNVKAASLRRDSAMMNVSAVYNSVLGDLFQAVIQWKSSFRKMQILKNLLKVQTELIQILQYQAKNGFSDFIIANQAISQKSLFESQLRLVESLYKSSQNQIERLVNKQFNELNSLFDENKCTEIFVPKLKNVLNVKMRTVENRPDVRSAKAMMLASNYDLKKAKLDFMPQLTLSGFFGLESYSIVTVSNPVWSIVTAFGMPVLNVGVAAATIDLSKAKNLEAVLNYQNTIALAIQEIRTALSDYLFNFSSIGNQKDAVRKLDDVVELNKEKFRSGLSNKIDLNSSIVAKYQVELDLIDQESNAATAYIRLQKALGIGVK